MSLKHRGQVIHVTGNTSENAGWIGRLGVITIDLERGAIHIHDGKTVGGAHVIYMADYRNFIEAEREGKADGIATLDKDAVLSQSQLPDSTRAIHTYAERSLFPKEGIAEVFYLDASNTSLWIWLGSEYKKIAGATTAYELGLAPLQNQTPIVLTDIEKPFDKMQNTLMTTEAFTAIMAKVGIYQESNGQWVNSNQSSYNDSTNSNNTGNWNQWMPHTQDDTYHDDTMGADNISHLDVSDNEGTLTRPAAIIHKSLIADTATPLLGQDYPRFKYGSTDANWSEMTTYENTLMDETGPMAIINYDKTEFAMGVINFPGNNISNIEKSALVTLNKVNNQVTMEQRRSKSDPVFFCVPVSFGPIDGSSVEEFSRRNSISLDITSPNGQGVTYNSSWEDDRIVIKEIAGNVETGRVFKGQKGQPFQGVIDLKVTEAQAKELFPDCKYLTIEGDQYVQVTGMLDVSMTVIGASFGVKRQNFPVWVDTIEVA